jgi:hypothetical protein
VSLHQKNCRKVFEAEPMSIEVTHSAETNLSATSEKKIKPKPTTQTQVLPAADLPAPFASPQSLADPPFTGVAGRLFMRACLWAELAEGWITKSSARDRLESALTRRFGSHSANWLPSLVAAALCSLVAACLLPLFWENSMRPLVPFVFLLVIFYVAVRFGKMAGIVGTIGAALVFELFLFEPRFSLAISSTAERNHLITMVVAGLCVSELLGRRKPPTGYKPY